LFFLRRSVDFSEYWQKLTNINLGYFALAVVAFNLSKIIAAFRLNYYYKMADVVVSAKFNVKLYYVGMFFNTFMPGSIGGDAYKVFFLKQHYDTKTKYLVSASLLDRLSGLCLLVVLGLGFLLFSSIQNPFEGFKPLVIAAMILALPVFYLFKKLLFKRFTGNFLKTSWLSFWVQVGQAVSAFFLLKGFGVSESHWDYLAVFMASSAASALPAPPGGIGLREWVMSDGVQLMNSGLDANLAAAFATSFFLVIAVTALIGVYFFFSIRKPKKANK